MDVFLVILTIFFALLLLGANIYFLIYYLDENEKGFADSWFVKIVVITGLMLAWAQVLTLPLDVSNSRGDGGGLRIDIMWQIIYMMLFIYIVFLLPTTLFFYESDDQAEMKTRICYTLKHLIFILIIVALILGIMYGVFGWCSIPVETYVCEYSESTSSDSGLVIETCQESDIELEMPVTFPIYVMGLLSFVGWWFVVVFGGIGLSAVPLDLINSYRFRPRKLTPDELATKQRLLKDRASELLEIAAQVQLSKSTYETESGWFNKRKLKNSIRTDMNKLEAETLMLEADYDIFEQEKNYTGIKVYKYPLELLLGILCGVVSILWFLHTLLYVAIRIDDIPEHAFLNNMLNALEAPSVSFLGTSLYCLLVMYLLIAVIKGNIKFGLRFFFCCRAHPIKKDATPMNSILFNLNLLLLASVAVTLFCTNAFSQYTRLSDINNMFGIEVRFLVFFKYFYENNVFEIMLLVRCMEIWAFFSAVFLAFKSRDTTKIFKSNIDMEYEKDKLKIKSKNNPII